MQIKKIHIQNFKSLVDFELDSPKQFCAFVGPNASGKSNIFEALEFLNFLTKFSFDAHTFFGGMEDIVSFNKEDTNEMILGGRSMTDLRLRCFFNDNLQISYGLQFRINKQGIPGIRALTSQFYSGSNSLNLPDTIEFRDPNKRIEFINNWKLLNNIYENDYEIFIDNFSRIFVGKSELVRINSKSPKLKTDASNLAQILWQIFQDENKKEDFIDWLRILIPEFEDIVVKQSNIDDSHEFFVKEKGSEKLFPRRLLSDGTKNILALMAAVYQSNEPQFLCIEEPENGLHPEAIELLVDFFRDKCENEGHHIWLNTHSPTLVRSMKIDEIVLVNKIDGQTKARTVLNANELDIKTDEAWLTNALGGGVSWSK